MFQPCTLMHVCFYVFIIIIDVEAAFPKLTTVQSCLFNNNLVVMWREGLSFELFLPHPTLHPSCQVFKHKAEPRSGVNISLAFGGGRLGLAGESESCGKLIHSRRKPSLQNVQLHH